MQLDLETVPIAVSAHNHLALGRNLDGEPFGVPEKRGVERGLGEGVRRPRVGGDVDDEPPVLQRREPGRQTPHEPVQRGDWQRGRLCDLPGDYEVYPGHMDSSSLERERNFNYYCREAVRLFR